MLFDALEDAAAEFDAVVDALPPDDRAAVFAFLRDVAPMLKRHQGLLRLTENKGLGDAFLTMLMAVAPKLAREKTRRALPQQLEALLPKTLGALKAGVGDLVL